MNMTEWAENEIKIACKKEAPNRQDNEWDCGCACYESALKAYKSLMEDDHSGASFSITKNILIRLMNNNPLTPITDEDFFVDDDYIRTSDEFLLNIGLKSSIQCPRKSSLFRDVHLDDTIVYHDADRVICREMDSDIWYYNGFISKFIHSMFPITMPYMPENNKFEVVVKEFNYNSPREDYDTFCIVSIKKPNGELVNMLDRVYFKETESGWEKISAEEYTERWKNRLYD